MFKALVTYAAYIRKCKKLSKIINFRIQRTQTFFCKNTDSKCFDNNIPFIKTNYKTIKSNNWINIIILCF